MLSTITSQQQQQPQQQLHPIITFNMMLVRVQVIRNSVLLVLLLLLMDSPILVSSLAPTTTTTTSSTRSYTTTNIPPNQQPPNDNDNEKQKQKKNGGMIRLTSWNVLAPPYCLPAKYPWCDPKHLEWEYRQSLIVTQLLSFNSDIICLQEVQVDLFPALIEELQPYYTGILQNVTGDHSVGCAILIRQQQQQQQQQESVPTNNGDDNNDLKNDNSNHKHNHHMINLEVVRVESRSRALIVVLQQKDAVLPTSDDDDVVVDDDTTSQHPFLYLCNVHLEAGMTHEDNLIRYHQLKSLFKRLQTQCRKDGYYSSSSSTNGGGGGSDASIILAGDFNMLHSNPLHTFLSKGLLEQPSKKKGRDNNRKITRSSTSTATATGGSRNKVRKTAVMRLPMPITKLRDAYLCGMNSKITSRTTTPTTLSSSDDNVINKQKDQDQDQEETSSLGTTVQTMSTATRRDRLSRKSSNKDSKAPPYLSPSVQQQQQPQLAMTYSSGNVLDYIWASEAVEIYDTLLLHPQAATRQAQKWPSQDHPSDHLPIGIDLAWGRRGTPEIET